MEAVDAEVVEPALALSDVHVKTLTKYFSEVPAIVNEPALQELCNRLIYPAQAQILDIDAVIQVAQNLTIQSNEQYEDWCDKGSFCKTAINDITETRKRVTRQFDDAKKRVMELPAKVIDRYTILGKLIDKAVNVWLQSQHAQSLHHAANTQGEIKKWADEVALHQAARHEAAGDKEAAAQLLDSAASRSAPAIQPISLVPRTSGATVKKDVLHFNVCDADELARDLTEAFEEACGLLSDAVSMLDNPDRLAEAKDAVRYAHHQLMEKRELNRRHGDLLTLHEGRMEQRLRAMGAMAKIPGVDAWTASIEGKTKAHRR